MLSCEVKTLPRCYTSICVLGFNLRTETFKSNMRANMTQIISPAEKASKMKDPTYTTSININITRSCVFFAANRE